jgi:hypothetical protein
LWIKCKLKNGEREKNEYDGQDVQGQKNEVIIENNLRLLLDVVHVSNLWSSKQYECIKCHWKTSNNNKGKGSAKEWAQTKAVTGSGIIENNKNRRGVEKNKKRRCVEYLAVGCKVVSAFIIIIEMCRKEGV